MMNFCTLFDSYYIHKGIALYLSLEKVSDDFHLYVMAFDEDCYNKLKTLEFKHLTVELAKDFETQELLAVKPFRSKAEYCWTCGPSVIYHFINKYRLPSLTCVDADLWFLHNPKIAFDEIGDSSVAITEHFYDPKDIYARNSPAGKYCVQFTYFKNDIDGIACLKWWRDRCIEWCYSRYEDGKCGDQKYLESFEKLFKNVHVIKNRAVPLAPWNMNSYKYKDGFSLSLNGVTFEIVFFHMHGLSFIENGDTLVGKARYEITDDIKEYFYTPYMTYVAGIYNNYLGGNIKQVKVVGRSWKEAIWQRLKLSLRENKTVRFLYYKMNTLLKVDHATKESKKC